MVLKSNFTKTKQKQTKQPEAYDLTTRPTTIEQRRHQRDLQLSNNVETTRLTPFYFILSNTTRKKPKRKIITSTAARYLLLTYDNYFLLQLRLNRCKIIDQHRKNREKTTTDTADTPRTTQRHQQQKTRPTMEPTYRRPDAQTRIPQWWILCSRGC